MIAYAWIKKKHIGDSHKKNNDEYVIDIIFGLNLYISLQNRGIRE